MVEHDEREGRHVVSVLRHRVPRGRRMMTCVAPSKVRLRRVVGLQVCLAALTCEDVFRAVIVIGSSARIRHATSGQVLLDLFDANSRHGGRCRSFPRSGARHGRY
jgi:hypothetical protein